MLAHLSSVGLKLHHRLPLLRERLVPFGLTLSDQGDVRVLGATKQAPNHTGTGAAMRKAGDVKNSTFLNGREIRIVIDDRTDPARAEVERQILGSLVKAMRLTKLQQFAKPGGMH